MTTHVCQINRTEMYHTPPNGIVICLLVNLTYNYWMDIVFSCLTTKQNTFKFNIVGHYQNSVIYKYTYFLLTC